MSHSWKDVDIGGGQDQELYGTCERCGIHDTVKTDAPCKVDEIALLREKVRKQEELIDTVHTMLCNMDYMASEQFTVPDKIIELLEKYYRDAQSN